MFIVRVTVMVTCPGDDESVAGDSGEYDAMTAMEFLLTSAANMTIWMQWFLLMYCLMYL